MKTFLYSLFLFLIVGLGLFGLLTSFLDNPKAILVQVIIIAVVAAVGLFLFRRLADGFGREESARYRKAAKMSVKRRKSGSASRKTRGMNPSKLKVISNDARQVRGLSHNHSRPQGHLTVIDGKKNKKKKRVLF